MFNNGYGYVPPYMPQMQRLQQMEQQYPQFAQQGGFQMPQGQVQQQVSQPVLGLQGKLIDNADVVKVMDIPMDGSISYFPLADGSSILTKQLQSDGTSKILMYKLTEQKEEKVEIKNFITREEVEEMVKEEPNVTKEIKDEMKNIKRQIRDIIDDIKEIKRKD